MAKVVLKNIKKVYDNNVEAVKGFSLTVSDKEFVVLVGPSGCGKSTTLRMVAGLEDISEGELYIDDKRVNDLAPKDRDIAMVFQNYALYPHMTVYENMAFALKLKKASKEEIGSKVNQTAEILGIVDLLERKPKALSGGQRQRVAIGRAIVREPKVFLMDEPLSNLDAKLRNQMRSEIIKLRNRIDTTFIYVTHDQTEAMTLGDRIVIMKDGYVQQIGTPQEVFNDPANLFVACFIGSPQMNIFAARLNVTTDKIYEVKIDGFTVPVSPKYQDSFIKKRQEPCDVLLGVRPENIYLTNENEQNGFDAKVDVCEMMGSEVYIHMRYNESTIVLRMPSLLGGSLFNKTVSDKFVKVAFHSEFMYLFDPLTERNMILP